MPAAANWSGNAFTCSARATPRPGGSSGRERSQKTGPGTAASSRNTRTCCRSRPGAQLNPITEELLDYAGAEQLTLLAYSPLLTGWYARPERRVRAAYEHPASAARYAALTGIAKELNATPNQVVLAWLLHHQPRIIPIPGASSVAQLDEILGATGLKLDETLLSRLDQGGRSTGIVT